MKDQKKTKEWGSVYFFWQLGHPLTDFLGRFWGEKNDKKVKNIHSILFFVVQLDFVNPGRVLTQPISEFFLFFFASDCLKMLKNIFKVKTRVFKEDWFIFLESTESRTVWINQSERIITSDFWWIWLLTKKNDTIMIRVILGVDANSWLLALLWPWNAIFQFFSF